MLRIATIGTSMITDDFIQVVNANDQATFVGTLSRDADRGAAFTAEHGGERNFTALDELASADDVDAVYIGSPNALHHEQALACTGDAGTGSLPRCRGSRRRGPRGHAPASRPRLPRH